MKDWLIEHGVDWIFEKLAVKWEDIKNKEDLKKLISEYNERVKEQLETVTLHEEIDFGGLELFVERELEKSIIDSVLEKELNLRASKRNAVYRAAYTAGAANGEIQKQQIERYMDVVFDFINEVSNQHTDKGIRSYVNLSIDKLDEKHNQTERRLEQKINSLQQQEQISPFTDMIEKIGSKAESTNEFHYLNSSIGFWGREEEMDALNAFLDDERKVLFMSIVAPGASGKSKLVHEFVKQHALDDFWEMKYISKVQINRLLEFSDYSYSKNLVFIVDYAGLYAEKLGEWLMYLLSLKENTFPQKIRLIMLERGRMIQISSGEIEPLWKGELLQEGERRENLKKIWYHASCFGPMGELQPLGKKALCQIMVQYADSHGRILSDEELDQLIACLEKVDTPKEYASRPLFALLIVESYVNRRNVYLWDTSTMMEQCIMRVKQQWKALSGDDKQLYNAIQDMVLYATATEGLELDQFPEFLNEANKKINSLDDESYTQLICGVNQEIQYKDFLYPMEPDIVGEYYLIQSFMKSSCRKELLRQKISAYWLKTENFFNVFVRCIHDYCNNADIKKFLRENVDLLLPPDRNDLEIEAHSRLLHFMMIKFRGKKNQDVFSGKIKELYNKYPKHKVVINDYAASLMLEFQNHIVKCWEQEENVEKIKKLLLDDPDNDYLLNIYGKSLFNQIVSYCNYRTRVYGDGKAECEKRIRLHNKELCDLVRKHPNHDSLKISKDKADMTIRIMLQ